MPSEKIYLNGKDSTAPVPLVSWGRERGYVQIATVAGNAHEVLTGWTEATPEWIAAFEQHRSSDLIPAGITEFTKPGTSFHTFDGFYASLDQRWQINALIKLLRNARDGAFGKDE